MSAESTRTPDQEHLLAVVEAVVFSSAEPVSPDEIAAAIEEVGTDEVETALRELERRYRETGSGLRFEWVAGGVQLATRSEVGAWVRRFFRHRNRTRISSAALETLAIVAYRQPVTAPEIQAIRGKDPSASLKTLVDKKLIRILGKKKVVGRPILYGTSKQFLVHFGLNSLEDLPAIEEFEEIAGSLELLAAAQADGGDPAPGPTDDAADGGPAEGPGLSPPPAPES